MCVCIILCNIFYILHNNRFFYYFFIFINRKILYWNRHKNSNLKPNEQILFCFVCLLLFSLNKISEFLRVLGGGGGGFFFFFFFCFILKKLQRKVDIAIIIIIIIIIIIMVMMMMMMMIRAKPKLLAYFPTA